VLLNIVDWRRQTVVVLTGTEEFCERVLCSQMLTFFQTRTVLSSVTRLGHGSIANSIVPELVNGFEPKLTQILTTLGFWSCRSRSRSDSHERLVNLVARELLTGFERKTFTNTYSSQQMNWLHFQGHEVKCQGQAAMTMEILFLDSSWNTEWI